MHDQLVKLPLVGRQRVFYHAVWNQDVSHKTRPLLRGVECLEECKAGRPQGLPVEGRRESRRVRLYREVPKHGAQILRRLRQPG
jgi:hypothetical protein